MFCYTSCFIFIYKVFIKKKTKKNTSKQTQVIRLSICNYFKMEDFNNHLENIFIDLGPHFLFFRTYLVSVFGFFYFDIWPNFQAHFYTHSIITSRPFILKFNPKTHFLLLSSSTAVVTHYFPPPFPLRSHILFCFLSFPSSLHPLSRCHTPRLCRHPSQYLRLAAIPTTTATTRHHPPCFGYPSASNRATHGHHTPSSHYHPFYHHLFPSMGFMLRRFPSWFTW